MQLLHAIAGDCPICQGDEEVTGWPPGLRPQLIDTAFLCPRCVWGLRVLDVPMRIDTPRTESA
jgi:hypothetical protein